MTPSLRTLVSAVGLLVASAVLQPHIAWADSPNRIPMTPAGSPTQVNAALLDHGPNMSLAITGAGSVERGHDENVTVQVVNNRSVAQTFSLAVGPATPFSGSFRAEQILSQSPGVGCQINQGSVTCPTATLASGATANIVIAIHGDTSGDAGLQAVASMPDRADSHLDPGVTPTTDVFDAYARIQVGLDLEGDAATLSPTCHACVPPLHLPVP